MTLVLARTHIPILKRSFRLAANSRFLLRYYAAKIVKVPTMADSITEGALGSWEKKVGDRVKRDELIANIETDKITLPVNAPEDGVLLEVYAQPGDTVQVGADLYKLDVGGEAAPAKPAAKAAAPEVSRPTDEKTGVSNQKQAEPKVSEQLKAPEPKVVPSAVPSSMSKASQTPAPPKPLETVNISNASRPLVGSSSASTTTERTEKVTKMTPIRLRIAQRLKESQQTSASLTTFNEVDMTAVMDIRNQYKDAILKKYNVKLGFMSAFIRSATTALLDIPMVNSHIEEGQSIVQPNYVDISVAVATPKGLVTPVLRNCHTMTSLVQIEKSLAELGEKARLGQLTLNDLNGGTFTISNGGVFGSMMGTPIINVPQSAILGMHAIKDRPVVINGKIEIRPMMYLALTYDHRIIDGREAVTFLVRIKDLLEDPRRFLLDI